MLESRIHLLSILLPIFIVAGCDKQEETPVTTAQPQTTETAAPVQPQVADNGLGSDKNTFSYALGVQIGQNMLAQGLGIDQGALVQGVNDMVNKAELKMTTPEMEQAIAAFQAQEQQRQMQIAQKNLAAGEAFLAGNKQNPDVTVTASGLQYKVITQGTGPQPKATDSVVVHYRGTFIDGTEFDSSYGRGEPITITLDQVIPAWQEVVPMMPVGSKWQVFIPSKLGYGEATSGPIGPNSTLIFDVELLSIAEAPAPAMTPVP